MYWEIEPSHDPDFDSCCMPTSTEKHHRAALAYAKQRLEEAWDSLTPDGVATVKIALRSGDIPEELIEGKGRNENRIKVRAN
jgi:hypothetical protein